MNLTESPVPEQLAALLRACDDTIATHVIWVDVEGEVHVTPLDEPRPLPKNRTRNRPNSALPRPLTPAGWARENAARIKFRLEACARGAGQTGPAAAGDPVAVSRFYGLLVKHWRDGSSGLVG